MIADESYRHEAGPHWDDNLATLTESTDTHAVTIDVDPQEDGSLRLRKCVMRKAYRHKDQHICWIGTIAIIPAVSARVFMIDAVEAYAASKS